MPDFRVFCPSPPPAAAELTLSAAESHHLVSVNRARRGDPVIAFDGQGREWETTVQQADRRAATLAIQTFREAAHLPCRITLAQAVPKGGVMESIVRHATEIGVHRIVPVLTSRTQVQWDDKRQSRKQEKWTATALEAAKQCGNPWLPEIDEPRPLAEAAASLIAQHDASLVASLHPGAAGLHETVSAWTGASTAPPPPSLMWWVGPEGDFTSTEMDQLVNLGARPVSLGRLVLRCDTAATYALAVISAALNP
ncbi:RsmE family RNA methyltransferase [Actomonas aquatica]|uniref:Ribosomal RNA small subunit methyltransferase E n=1 Tax=Actomonas aquatica TaxID=2866162 RepID=A0ABZ1C5V5_9BACT|nr:RsmE family RNA methyltransferase [Opitutus sp. WL0086]WRQ87116.1 RsmE family RNA methyltransferase [Opitutus sp. WL0086]